MYDSSLNVHHVNKSNFSLENGLQNLPKKTKRITSGTILLYHAIDGLEVALIRNKWSKKWGFPKGGVEKNESLKSAAQRETFEETGLFIKISNSDNSYRINKTTYFIKLLENKLKMNPKDKNEILDSRWFNIKELPNNPEISTRDIRIFRELQKGSLKTQLENIEKQNLSTFKIKTSYTDNKEKDDRYIKKWNNMVIIES
jgi:8-oxo-dGTP pyrophosphatase MutT (NUDIX family)